MMVKVTAEVTWTNIKLILEQREIMTDLEQTEKTAHISRKCQFSKRLTTRLIPV